MIGLIGFLLNSNKLVQFEGSVWACPVMTLVESICHDDSYNCRFKSEQPVGKELFSGPKFNLACPNGHVVGNNFFLGI